MDFVFLLWYQTGDNEDDAILIGVYRTEDDAKVLSRGSKEGLGL